MSVFMLRSYTRIRDNQVVISKSSLFHNEKTYQYEDFIGTSYMLGCSRDFDKYVFKTVCFNKIIKERMGILDDEQLVSSQNISDCDKNDLPFLKNKLIQINIITFIFLVLLIIFIYRIATDKILVKRKHKRNHIIIKIIFPLLPLLYIIYLSLPLLQDSFWTKKFVKESGIFTYQMGGGVYAIIPDSVYREIIINKMRYYLVFDKIILNKGDLVEFCYLPKTKIIADINILNRAKILP